MKKLLALLLSVTLACSFMAGCGDEDDSSSKKSNKDDSAVSTVDESADGKADTSSEDTSSKDEAEKPDESKADESKPDDSKPDGGDADNSTFEGKWECESMTMGGVKLEGDLFGVPIAVAMQIELKSDGKGTHYEYDDDGEAEAFDITWKADGNTLTFVREGDAIDFELKDGKLTASYSEEGQDISVVLKKVDKFTEYDAEITAPEIEDFEPDDVTEAELIGKWECESMAMGGMTIKDNLMGIPVGVLMQIELKQGGSGTHYENSNGTTEETAITWKLENKIATFEMEGDKIEFKMKDGKLIGSVTEEGQTVSFVLKKVDKFTVFTEEDAQDILGSLLGGEE